MKRGKDFCGECRSELKRRDLDKLTYEIYCPKCGVKFRSSDYGKIRAHVAD